jgi:drug/metabolite transporter (DMT)-like permease
VHTVDFSVARYDSETFFYPRMRTERLTRILFSPYTLLTLTALFWAGNWVVGRAMRNAATPISLAFWRWAVAWVLLLPFALPHMRREWRTIWQSRRILLILGLLGTGTYNALSYTGLQYTSVANAVMLNSVIPILIAAVSWAFVGERLTRLQGLGVLISLGGVLYILSRGDPERLMGLRFNTGDLWVFASMLVWAIYTVVLRWRPKNLHPLAFLATLATVGLAAMLPLTLFGTLGGGIRLTPASALGLLYLGIFPALLAYIFWNRAVAEVGPNVSGLFMHLIPVFGTALAILFLDERLYFYHFAGLALILSGLYLTSRFGDAGMPAGAEVEEYAEE